MIRAKAWTDDHKYEVDFDAEPFFKTAGSDKIVDLAACGWRGDYPADAVAEFCEDYDTLLKHLFHYLKFAPTMPGSFDPVGFECEINSSEARRWLAVHRPSVLAHIEAAVDEEGEAESYEINLTVRVRGSADDAFVVEKMLREYAFGLDTVEEVS